LETLPAVTDISRSVMVTSLGSNYTMTAKYYNSQDSVGNVWVNFVDDRYLPIHQHVFVAGRNFIKKAPTAQEDEIVVTEGVLKQFDIAGRDPQKALGEQLTMENKKLTIVGVLKDFHYETVEDEIAPTVLRYDPARNYRYVNIKVDSRDPQTTMARIESAWKKIDKVHPFNAQFYDDQIEHAYAQFSVMIKVIGFLAFLAICIASMGLFGMVVFTTETKLKEISIRKVLGATEGNLVVLLSRGFLLLLTVAAAIALPVTYLFFDRVVLVKFAYHDPIGWLDVFLGFAGVLLIAALMIASQTLKVARANPALTLKQE
jgi:ABC-type antimicrobial peptide transport system permease subunit